MLQQPSLAPTRPCCRLGAARQLHRRATLRGGAGRPSAVAHGGAFPARSEQDIARQVGAIGRDLHQQLMQAAQRRPAGSEAWDLHAAEKNKIRDVEGTVLQLCRPLWLLRKRAFDPGLSQDAARHALGEALAQTTQPLFSNSRFLLPAQRKTLKRFSAANPGTRLPDFPLSLFCLPAQLTYDHQAGVVHGVERIRGCLLGGRDAGLTLDVHMPIRMAMQPAPLGPTGFEMNKHFGAPVRFSRKITGPLALLVAPGPQGETLAAQLRRQWHLPAPSSPSAPNVLLTAGMDTSHHEVVIRYASAQLVVASAYNLQHRCPVYSSSGQNVPALHVFGPWQAGGEPAAL